jgi:hypothetical protein
VRRVFLLFCLSLSSFRRALENRPSSGETSQQGSATQGKDPHARKVHPKREPLGGGACTRGGRGRKKETHRAALLRRCLRPCLSLRAGSAAPVPAARPCPCPRTPTQTCITQSIHVAHQQTRFKCMLPPMHLMPSALTHTQARMCRRSSRNTALAEKTPARPQTAEVHRHKHTLILTLTHTQTRTRTPTHTHHTRVAHANESSIRCAQLQHTQAPPACETRKMTSSAATQTVHCSVATPSMGMGTVSTCLAYDMHANARTHART